MTHILKHTVLVASAISLLSCSVKEDRDGCPCWLDIDVSACSRHSDVVYLKGWHKDEKVIGDKVYLSDFPDIYEKAVPRGMLEYTAYLGTDVSLLSGDSVLIPEGHQSDKLYAYRATVWAEGETAWDVIVPHKQFATVTVRINESVDEDTGITILGETAGFNVADMTPVRGNFTYSTVRDENGLAVFRLPRQINKELTMSLTRDDDVITTLQLGDLITQAGYDWSATDLDDIFIDISSIGLDTPVTVSIWIEGNNYDYYF